MNSLKVLDLRVIKLAIILGSMPIIQVLCACDSTYGNIYNLQLSEWLISDKIFTSRLSILQDFFSDNIPLQTAVEMFGEVASMEGVPGLGEQARMTAREAELMMREIENGDVL